MTALVSAAAYNFFFTEPAGGNPLSALRSADSTGWKMEGTGASDANPATEHMFIIKPFGGGGMRSLFSSHPPTEARVRALLGTI